jgi:TRAP-type C4-dicarboxylate transport system substrate-binding protein
MALVCVANVSASQTGQEMHVIVELPASPVSHQAVEKFAQAMETANVGLVSVMRERKDVTQENSARNFQ